MRRLRRYAFAAALIAALVGSLVGRLKNEPAAGKKPAAARIVEAIDGDTIEVEIAGRGRESIRLIGIDTPETVRPGTPVECGGEAASAAMHAFDGVEVKLIADPSQDNRDRYGRLLRYVESDRRDVGRAIVSQGLAAVYVYDEPFARLRPYQRSARKARRAERGVWGACSGDFHQSLAGSP